MNRNLDTEAAIIANDLDSLALRIEALQAHPRYTDALVAVQNAKQAMIDGRVRLHQSDMKARHIQAVRDKTEFVS
jgi:hypothetical protein